MQGLGGELYVRCHKDTDTGDFFHIYTHPAADMIAGAIPPKAVARAERIAAELVGAAQGTKPEAVPGADQGQKPDVAPKAAHHP